MKTTVAALAAILSAALLAGPALAAEPLTLECEWAQTLSTKSDFDQTRKESRPRKILLTFDFDAKDVMMDGVDGAAHGLTATTNAISFCIDSCESSGPFERKTENGVVTATRENGRVNINRLTAEIRWANTEEQYQGKQHYKTIVTEYVGECRKTELMKPKF